MLLSNAAFNCNLRHYTKAAQDALTEYQRETSGINQASSTQGVPAAADKSELKAQNWR